jgi:RHS repeat-associated protein
MIRGGQPFFYLPDGLGSTRLLTDATGSVTDTYGYEGYGDLAVSSGASDNPYRFSGERLDADADLYNLRARWMDPVTGRFISRDVFPGILTDPNSLHSYSYANDDPVNGIDPTGYFTLIETQEVVQILGELAQQSISVLRFYQQAKRLADIIELVHGLGQAAATAVQILDGGIMPGFPGEIFGGLPSVSRRYQPTMPPQR